MRILHATKYLKAIPGSGLSASPGRDSTWEPISGAFPPGQCPIKAITDSILTAVSHMLTDGEC
ncbi:hypothetical protein ARTHRO9V_280051 [Arthrobacter sp. 9V]|nr:hypothetical protein ARTHRO9V_280051 [Arthrobacter sp. 9V]